MKNKRGITLVSLVVTIIILVILAGVSITTLGGENGIITQAIRAQEESKKAEYREKINIIIQEEQMNKLSKKSEKLFIEQLAENIGKQEWTKTTTICNKEFKEAENDEQKEIIIVNTNDGYEITIKVDNIKIEAEIISIIKGKAKTYKVTYHANNGTNEKVEVEIREGFSTEIIENTYEREGYEFVGWSTNKEAEEVEYVQGNKIENIKDNIDLYAIWSTNTATITFHGNNKTYTQTVQKGTSTPLETYSQTGINYTGYLFKGWSETENGQVKYTDGAEIQITEDINLYGVFEQDNVTATLSVTNGGSTTNILTKGTTIQINATSTKTEISNIKLEMINNNSVVATIYQDSTTGTSKNITLDGLEEDLINLNKLTIFTTYICRLTATTETGATAQQSISITDYTVGSANDLNILATNVNNGTTYSGKTITLVADMTTTENYVPIGYYSGVGIYTGLYFAGIFEGNNHTITLSSISTNLSEYNTSGIFGMVIGGEIYNLTVDGTNSSKIRHSAGIVGAIKDGKIVNCVNNCTLTDTTKSNKGGIVGSSYGSEITGCKNTVAIKGYSYVGGICGYAYENTKINNCSNSGMIDAYGTCNISVKDDTMSADYSIYGGIVGYSDNCEISNCSNSKLVQRPSIDSNLGASGGGIVGLATNNTNITLCKNTGPVYYLLDSGTTSNGGALGGIAGCAEDSSIDQCYNTGWIIAGEYMSVNRGMQNLGGIVGWGYNSTLKNSYNCTDGIFGNNNIGGIIGNAESVTMSNCYNETENITGNSNVGDLGGYIKTSTGANNSSFDASTAIGGETGNSFSNYQAYTLTQMKTLNSGLLTLLNTGDGAGLWAQSADVNDGLPYLKNLKP